MAAGRPGDNPVVDLLRGDMCYYGPELDGLFRDMAQLMSVEELHRWWDAEVGWGADVEKFRTALFHKIEWARDRASSDARKS